MRNGYTLAELLVVIGLITVLEVVSLASLVSRRNRSQLTSTTSTMAGLLREAQSRSAAQSSDTNWGVHFDNGTPAFFALFSGTYAANRIAGYYALPGWVAYSTSSIAAGSYAEVTFTQISGAASGSS